MSHLSMNLDVSKPSLLALVLTCGALLTAGTQVAFAAPRRPPFPNYNILEFCFVDFGQGTHDMILRDLCSRDERAARNELRRRWSTIPAQQLQACMAAVADAQKKHGGEGSYQGIRHCLGEMKDAAESARTATASRAPARQPSPPAAPASLEPLPTLPDLPSLPAGPAPQTPGIPKLP